MNRLTFVLLLGVAALLAFVEGRGIIREGVFGTRIDVLPVLVTYAALRGDIYTLVGFTCFSGLLFDTLSANPLGVSMLSLTLVGVLLIQMRGLILRNQVLAQMALGTCVATLNPIVNLFLVWALGLDPVVGWGSLFQIGVMGISGAILAPFFFMLFDWLEAELTYAEEPFSRFRFEVEIKRGRG